MRHLIFFFWVVAGLFSFQPVEAGDSLTIVSPLTRIVYQRDNNNRAVVFIKGHCPAGSTAIKAKLVARSAGQGTSTEWVTIDQPHGDHYSGTINAQAGWYNLEVCAVKKKKKIATAVRERVGIGEVFIIVGHSVAQGGDINLEGSADDRVSTVALSPKSEMHLKYEKTGDPRDLPDPVFSLAASGVALAPFGGNSYFWSKFGEHLAKKENVPVLLYNAAFGGTSLEHWAKSSQNIQFEHGFVRSNIQMPYINLKNALLKYIPVTGIRAVLADQGQNDNPERDAEKIFRNYQIFVKQARDDFKYPQLALVVNRQTPSNNNEQVRIAQEKMEKQPYSFPGPDYDKIMVKEDRYDGIHLSKSGLVKAAQAWADALTPDFFRSSRPWLPESGR